LEWTARFGPLGLRCVELTGDSGGDGASATHLSDADIILTTPEKFDAVTRRNKGRDGLSFLADIGLVLLDEVHTLSDDRGPALEAVMSRLKLMGASPQLAASPLSRLRCVGVSATIPNICDLAAWLGGPRCVARAFGEEYRATALEVFVHGYNAAANEFLFERNLKYALFPLVQRYSENQFPVLIFCSSRKGAEEACRQLVEAVPAGAGTRGGPLHPFIATAEAANALADAAASCDAAALGSSLRAGVGFHSAGLTGGDRQRVETLFRSGALRALCTTSTLALGVNLPARVVIVKGTRLYDKGEYKEYPRAAILQMIGRAGRPQFDDRGVGVIMCERHRVATYQQLASGLDAVESRLGGALAEHLNAEIVAGTVADVSQAVVWFKASFLWHRMCSSPQKYGLPPGVSPAAVEAHANTMLVEACSALRDAKCAVSPDADGFLLATLPPGQEMARRYVCFNTVRLVQTLAPHAGAPDLLYLLSRAAEFSWVVLRHGEKTALKQLIGKVRYPLMDPTNGEKAAKIVTTASQKLFLLVQDALSDSPSETNAASHTLRVEADDVLRHGGRICRCMAAACLHDRRLSASAHALVLARCCELRIWDNSKAVARQFSGVGPVLSRALMNAGLTSLDALDAADPRRLEAVTGRMYPFGNTLKAAVARTPRVAVDIEPVTPVEQLRPGVVADFKVHVRIKPPVAGQATAPTGAKAASPGTLLCGTRHNDALIHWQRASVQPGPEFQFTIRVQGTVPPSGPFQLVAGLIFDAIQGRDATTVWEWKPKTQQPAAAAAQAPQAAVGAKRPAAASPAGKAAKPRAAPGPNTAATMTAVAQRGAALGPTPVAILQQTAPGGEMNVTQYHAAVAHTSTPEAVPPAAATVVPAMSGSAGSAEKGDAYDDSMWDGLF
jgi:ATP-dependent DNA helicase HFM1/MER3